MGAASAFLQLLETSPYLHDPSKMVVCDLVFALGGFILESNCSDGLIWLGMVTVRYLMVVRLCNVSAVCSHNGKCTIVVQLY